MTDTTLTRADLAEAINSEIGLSRSDSAQIVDALLGEISSALMAGDTVKISRFGSFHVRGKAKRIGRNPKTGEEVPIMPRRVLAFHASHMLKNKVNAAMGGDTSSAYDENDGDEE